MSTLLDSFQASFAALPAAAVDAHGRGTTRRAAMLRTMAEGLPSQRSERWKYTSLRALSARSFVASADTPRLHPAVLEAIPAPRLVFINGRLDGGLSELEGLPEALDAGALSAALQAGHPLAAETFTVALEALDEPFARLNVALASEGALIRVAARSQTVTPLHLVFVGAPAANDVASHLRHTIDLGADARLTLVEHHIASGAHRHFSNHFMQVRLGEGSILVHARLQDEDANATVMARTDATLAKNALYHRVDLELGASLSRHELNVSLLGEQARFNSSGTLLAAGRRHVDTRLAIEHQAANTTCDLLWRGLATDRGRLAFHGGISIQAGADGSDAQLSNKNLLLSDNAEIDTQPVLQIHADEVKAAHGATVGRLDETALFYLRTRGIPAAQARLLLTLAFCREALASIGRMELIQMLSPHLEARLAELDRVQ